MMVSFSAVAADVTTGGEDVAAQLFNAQPAVEQIIARSTDQNITATFAAYHIVAA